MIKASAAAITLFNIFFMIYCSFPVEDINKCIVRYLIGVYPRTGKNFLAIV